MPVNWVSPVFVEDGQFVIQEIEGVAAVPAKRVPQDLFEHYCEHPGCNEWGAFGFDKARQTRWL